MQALAIPEIFCPFPSQMNPHVESAEQQLTTWVQQFGLVQKETARQRFTRANFATFAACTYPTASSVDLALVSDWFAWLFLVDDQLDDGVVGRDLELVQRSMSDLLGVLGQDPNMLQRSYTASAVAQLYSSSAVAALSDLWRRSACGMNNQWRARFIRHVEDCFAAAYWEAQNRIHGVIPDVPTYVAKRRDTGAIYICMDLIDVVERLDIPVYLYESAIFQDLLDTASNVVCWSNDLYSLVKERELGEYHNLVLVVQHAQQLGDREAIDVVCRMIASEVERFIALEEQIFTIFPEYAEELQKYLAGMKSWMRGNRDWSSETLRYYYIEKAILGDSSAYLDSIM
jgi:hypothetical protein